MLSFIIWKRIRMLEKIAEAMEDSQYTKDINSTLSLLLLDKISSIFLWRSTLIFLSPISILLLGDIFKLILFDGLGVGPTQFSGVFHTFILKLIDSIIDRRGLLRTGDVILQANGKNIKDPEQLQTAIEESGPFVVFKILPSNVDQQEIESSLPKAGKVAKVKYN